MLHFQKFKKTYNHYSVLEVEDLTLFPGIYWVQGANGVGKTTLLKSIAGILAFEGELRFNNISLKHSGIAYRKQINFADAEPLFPEFLTGYEMITLFAQAKAAVKDQEKSYIEEMGMTGYIQTPISTYSSGMLKKLSLVLAFLGNPQLILFDEPLITIDRESLDILYNWIQQKHEQDGTSVILSSHQPVDSARLPDMQSLLIEHHRINLQNTYAVPIK